MSRMTLEKEKEIRKFVIHAKEDARTSLGSRNYDFAELLLTEIEALRQDCDAYAFSLSKVTSDTLDLIKERDRSTKLARLYKSSYLRHDERIAKVSSIIRHKFITNPGEISKAPCLLEIVKAITISDAELEELLCPDLRPQEKDKSESI